MNPFDLGILDGMEKTAAMVEGAKAQPHQEDLANRAAKMDRGGMIAHWGLGSGKTFGAFNVAEKRGGNTLVVVPAALRENFKGQMKQFVTPDRHSSYTVISYEQFKKDPEGWVKKTNPNNLVVDEFHRARNAGPRSAFEQVRGKVPFMLGLTGSPVNNHPDELAPLVNLAAGKKVFRSTQDFHSTYIQENETSPGIIGRLRGIKPGITESSKNLKGFSKNISPYVHRFSGDTEFRKHVPTVTEKTVKVPMNSEQENVYKYIAGKNPLLAWKIKHNLPPSKAELKNMNAFMVAMRQASNSPAEFDKRVTSYEEKVSRSPKFQAMLSEMKSRSAKDKNFKGVVFSNFLGSGVDPVVAGANARRLPAETFSGSLNDKERSALVKKYNSGDLKVLGLSPAGGEGLDLKGTKLVQLMEEHWNPERSAQAIGRSARYKSHAHLPENERNVEVQRYLAVHPDKWHHKLPFMKKPTSADEWISKRRQEKDQLNKQFIRAIPEYSQG